MCHDNEEWCKIWRGIDLSFQNWHEEFDEFWPKHLKISKIFILMCSFWAKYTLFELKKVQLSFMKLKRDTKFGEESTHCFKIVIRNESIWTMGSKVSKIFTLMRSLWANYILFEVKKYRWVIFHETEEGYKNWRGIVLSFQNWHNEFDKIWLEHSKVSKIFILIGSFWVMYILFEIKKYTGVIFHENEEGYKIWRGINLLFQN